MDDLSRRRAYVVCSEAPPDVCGGLGRYAERLMAAFAELDAPIEVFTATRGARGSVERRASVTVHRIRTIGGPGARGGRAFLARAVGVLWFNLVAVARILRVERGPATVAVHDWMGCLAGILCRLLGRHRVVLHVHSREWTDGGAVKRLVLGALEAVQVRLAAAIVVPSQAMRDQLVAAGWPADRMRVVAHGADDPALDRLAALDPPDRERIRHTIRCRYLPGGAGTLLVFAGRTSPHKGVASLVRALPHVLSQRDVYLVIVGARDDRLTALVADLGLADRVRTDVGFLPAVDVFAHFVAADACVFPSTYEPFGLVAVEAMALAVPVVVGPGYSAEVAGPAAVRCHGSAPLELAAAVVKAIDSPELGPVGAAYVRERFTWRQTAAATLAVYDEVLA